MLTVFKLGYRLDGGAFWRPLIGTDRDMDEAMRVFGVGERRLTMLLVGHWQEARDGRRCPLADDFTALVPDELLADCFTYKPAAEPVSKFRIAAPCS